VGRAEPLATTGVVVFGTGSRSGQDAFPSRVGDQKHTDFSVLGMDEGTRGFVWVDMARASNMRPGAHRVWAGAASGQPPC
jgi:hypothetical protein